jgi:hypothetical protein
VHPQAILDPKPDEEGPDMISEPTPEDEQRLRERAERRVKSQLDFRTHLLMYVMVNLVLVVIWAMTSGTFFWPIFPIVGWGIGIAAHAWDAFGPVDVVSEDRVRREMERMRNRKS